MLLRPGDRVLIVHRRLFDQDKSRYFVGTIDAYEQGLARVSGHTWIPDLYDGHLIKKEEMRTKIIALASGTLLIYVLPDSVDIQRLAISRDEDGRLLLSDGHSWRMDLTESYHSANTATR